MNRGVTGKVTPARFQQVLSELGIGSALSFSEIEQLVSAFDPHATGESVSESSQVESVEPASFCSVPSRAGFVCVGV